VERNQQDLSGGQGNPEEDYWKPDSFLYICQDDVHTYLKGSLKMHLYTHVEVWKSLCVYLSTQKRDKVYHRIWVAAVDALGCRLSLSSLFVLLVPLPKMRDTDLIRRPGIGVRRIPTRDSHHPQNTTPEKSHFHSPFTIVGPFTI